MSRIYAKANSCETVTEGNHRLSAVMQDNVPSRLSPGPRVTYEKSGVSCALLSLRSSISYSCADEQKSTLLDFFTPSSHPSSRIFLSRIFCPASSGVTARL